MKAAIKVILNPKVVGYIAAGLSALFSFASVMDDRAKDQTIKDLVKRVTELEKK